MKIFKYDIKDISAGIHINDIQYIFYTKMIETFTETVLHLKVHTIDDSDSFYFISDMEDQIKMISIFNELNSDTNIRETFGDYEATHKDVTDEILNNIDNYDSIENFNDRNTILESYYRAYTPDAVLDKIIDKGVSSLSKHDKMILDESVKYK